ncbi:hypothetical protein [Mesomycoplasma ovipneumoniae]
MSKKSDPKINILKISKWSGNANWRGVIIRKINDKKTFETI